MADSWLKPFSRHSKVSSQEIPIVEHLASTFNDDSHEAEEYFTPRLRPAARVSSYIGLHPTTPTIPPQLLPPDTFPNVRHPESIYYKPSEDQLAETLKVVMMNQSLMTPLPIEYNSCILHVLEAYQQLREGVAAKNTALETWEQQHLKGVKEMEELKVEWDSKETGYKADIKRLEVLLSETSYGLEQVMLLRSKSSVHGSKKFTEKVEKSVGTMKERTVAMRSSSQVNEHPGSTVVDQDPIILDDKIRNLLQSSTTGVIVPTTERSRKLFHHRGQTTYPKTTTVPLPTCESITSEKNADSRFRVLPRLSDGNLHDFTSPRMMESSQYLGEPQELIKSHLEALETQKTEEGFGFQSSISSDDSSSNSTHDRVEIIESSLGLGIWERPQKPLTQPAQNVALGIHDRSQEGGPELNSKLQLGFSFQPGDDVDLFTEDTVKARAVRKQLHEQIRQRGRNQAEDSSKGVPESRETVKRNLSPKSMKPNPATGSKPTIKRSSLGHGGYDGELSREGSSSSVVTAVRQKSSRSSINSSQSGQNERRRNEAATAAARAFKGKERKEDGKRVGRGS